ncbi:MAG: AAA family ATPase, partial [Anaerolineales bacterium]|nr:AAA family ATPase [Anaerolineales bacterium]
MHLAPRTLFIIHCSLLIALMRLKKLVLQGYKTFASKTEFQFEGGITAVVGPNGSGKSNVADAVRWVLGEQSYSTLRGKRTTDMIFAGSQKRPRAGMASATLTLDNHDGWLPIDYSEVEICRRAYRSGENEYLLNGQKVRLMDISDLLARAGVAEQTYTIIGQGLIDQALSLKADERRALFEEAAGISHYKNKRATTLRRLQETVRNLLRISDILSEIKPRLGSLKRQASRAQTYEQVRTDLQHLLRIWYGYQWERAKKRLRERRQEAHTAEQSWQKERAQLLAKQETIEAARQRLHDLQEQQQAKQTVRDNLRGRLEQARREVAILQERRVALERQLAESSEDLPALESQQKQAAIELEQSVNELTAVQNELTAQQAEFKQFEAGYQQQQAEIKKWQAEVQTQTATLRQVQNKLAQGDGQLAQLRERLAEQGGDAGENTAVLTKLAAETDQLKLVLASATTNSNDLRDQQKALLDQRRTLEKALRDQRRTLDQQRQAVNKANNELARQQARVEMLQKLRTPQVKIGPNVTVAGQLAQFVTIPSQHQRPIELALQARLGTLIVPSEADLWQIVQKRSAKEALILLSQRQVRPQAPPPAPDDTAVVGWASTLVEAKDGYQPIV